MYFTLLDFLKAFFSLFVIMDALGNVPIYAMLCQKFSKKRCIDNANKAILVAGTLLFLFLFFGEWILILFGIDFPSFKIAGGIIIAIFGIKFVLGIRFREQRAKEYSVSIVPLATPLITGPGVITTVLLLVYQYGYLLTIIVSLMNLFITWMALRNASYLLRLLGKQGTDVVTKVLGLLLTAIGIHFILSAFGFIL